MKNRTYFFPKTIGVLKFVGVYFPKIRVYGIICEKEHKKHDIFDFSEMLINKKDLLKLIEDLENTINRFKYKVNVIKEILNKTVNIFDNYYKINRDIIDNYNINKRNYFKLQNTNYLKNRNEILIKELNNIINDDKIYEYSLNKFYNEKGEKYIGEFKNGLKDGKGILYYDKDNEYKRQRYEGEFKNDNPEGKGIMYWNSGGRYEGDWKNGKKDGKGIEYYNDGDRYEGDWKNGKREGKGIYYFKNGNRYEGDFKNGKKEGKGIYYYKNGETKKGKWKNNKYIGK